MKTDQKYIFDILLLLPNCLSNPVDINKINVLYMFDSKSFKVYHKRKNSSVIKIGYLNKKLRYSIYKTYKVFS
jgi:hypothetical protein